MIKKYEIPIYNGTLYIHIGKPTYKLMKSIGFDQQPLDNSLACFVGHGTSLLLWFDNASFDISLAVHEAVHAKNHLYKYIGAEATFDNDEHEAYFMGWLVSRIEETYRKFENK